jgi:hypothetical protein
MTAPTEATVLSHSVWSASGFEQKMLCPGSMVLQKGQPDSSSVYADEGTAAHQVLTWAGQAGGRAEDYLGRNITVGDNVFEVDEEMAGHVQECLDLVRTLTNDGADGTASYDIRVNYSAHLGVPLDDAWGTADVVLLVGRRIIVIDFKYGKRVIVSAGHDVLDSSGVVVVRKPNAQMAMYAVGALELYGDFADFTEVEMIISQPRAVDVPSRYELPVADLSAWAKSTGRSTVATALNAAAMVGDPAWYETFVRVGEKQCRFCKAKGSCKSYREDTLSTVFVAAPATADEFQDYGVVELNSTAGEELLPEQAQWLAVCLNKVDMIENWCKGIRAETESRMLSGQVIPGHKLVQGRQGARKWVDTAEAEEVMKSMRLKVEDMYVMKPISPTAAEKLAPKPVKKGAKVDANAEKPVIGPRQWARLKEMIVRPEGKLHVAPLADPRTAIEVRPVADEFETAALEAPASEDDFC